MKKVIKRHTPKPIYIYLLRVYLSKVNKKEKYE